MEVENLNVSETPRINLDKGVIKKIVSKKEISSRGIKQVGEDFFKQYQEYEKNGTLPEKEASTTKEDNSTKEK